MENNKDLTVKELVKEAHGNAEKHGFWDDMESPSNGKIEFHLDGLHYTSDTLNAIGNRLMLIVSEVAEAEEGLRHNDVDNFAEELADVAIRLADLCGGLGIDLETEIKKKMEVNKSRPYLHNKAF